MIQWTPDESYLYHHQFKKNSISIQQYSRFNTPESKALHLPIKNENDQYFLCGNVRLDNRLDLIHTLKLTNSSLLTDEELILKAYQHWGVDCPNHLYGDFAFAIWDDKLRRLFAARDPLGYKTFYYYYVPNQFLLFATHPTSILRYPGLNIKLNEPTLAYNMVSPFPTKEETYYQNVKKIPPAHSMIFENSQIKILQYWSPNLVAPIRYKSHDDYYEHFNQLFEQAVNDRLRSSHPIASHLSGGLDSSAVTAIAATLLQKKNESLLAIGSVPEQGKKILVPRGKVADDSDLMEAVAASYPNINLIKIKGLSQGIFENLSSWHNHLETPFPTDYNRLWIDDSYRIAHQANARVLLTGQFGNFTISWSGPTARTLKHKLYFAAKNLPHRHLWLYRCLNKNQYPWESYAGINREFAFKQGILTLFKENPPYAGANSIAEFIATYLPDMSFNATGEAIYGIERRDPTGDRRIIEFCQAIPPDIFYDKKESRLLVRKAMKNYLPEKVLSRKTRGLQASDWYLKFNEELPLLKKTLDQLADSEFAQYFDIPALYDLLNNWQLPDEEKQTTVDVNFMISFRLKFVRSLTTYHFLEQFKSLTQKNVNSINQEAMEVI